MMTIVRENSNLYKFHCWVVRFELLTPRLVQRNRNSTPSIFGEPHLFNNLVSIIRWINFSAFLDYYGIGLNNHSTHPLWIGYSTRPVIEKKNSSHLILTYRHYFTAAISTQLHLTSLQLLRGFTAISLLSSRSIDNIFCF